jgi:hypothetical protein
MFSKSVHLSEVRFDILGTTAFLLAVIASYLLYPFRSSVGVRVFCSFTILVSVLLGFEFIGGILWQTLDKIAQYGQKR